MAKLIVYFQNFTNAPNKVHQGLHFTHVVHRRHLNLAKVLQLFLIHIYFFKYSVDRASQYIYFLISTNLMH